MSHVVHEVCLRCNMPTRERICRTANEFGRRFKRRLTADQVEWLAFMLATGISQPVEKGKTVERE
jgi:hypothetical protein